MKKLLSILLAVLLMAAILPTAAFADGPVIVLSTQKLRVNGLTVDCERYNIDGSNYFKLRDLAYALNGTGSQFSVSWDGENKCISLVSGEAYAPIGGELDPATTDKSASGAPSGDKLLINGEDYSSLSAYKFEGANFYKLKELGDALGFRVSYDTPSRTMIIVTRAYSAPAEWRTEESFWSSNQGTQEHRVATFDEEGRLLTSLFDAGSYRETYRYSYNDLGYEAGRSYEYVSDYGGETWEETSETTLEYDQWGLPARETTQRRSSSSQEVEITVETYTYDDNGLLIREETDSAYGRTVYEYERDARGDVIRQSVTYSDSDGYTILYTRDEEGRILRTENRQFDGTLSFSTEDEYDEAGMLVKETYVSEGYSSVTTYTYDEQGNLLNRHTDSSDWDSDVNYTYDEAGRQLSYEYYNGADLFTTIYTYDAEGRLVREEYSSPDGEYVIDYTYDAEGNPLSETYAGSDYQSRTDYVYDRAGSRKTETTVVTYPAATALILGVEALELAVGDQDFLYFYFEPYNSAQESVSWSSSDPAVAEVDAEGNVYARGAGTAVVAVTSENGLTAACTVTVVKDKYTLNLAAEELSLSAGESLPLRCSVSYVGTYAGYKIRWDRGDATEFSLEWGEWENGEIDLFVTGLKAGEASFRLQVISTDEETVYLSRTVHVTVRDDNASEKP